MLALRRSWRTLPIPELIISFIPILQLNCMQAICVHHRLLANDGFGLIVLYMQAATDSQYKPILPCHSCVPHSMPTFLHLVIFVATWLKCDVLVSPATSSLDHLSSCLLYGLWRHSSGFQRAFGGGAADGEPPWNPFPDTFEEPSWAWCRAPSPRLQQADRKGSATRSRRMPPLQAQQ
jgi:hypothetical protein